MSLHNLPAGIAAAIQQNFLEREFREPLLARLIYRSCADKDPFMANIGETLTKTRRGLFPAITVPLASSANTDLDNGLTAQYFTTEQYIQSIAQYAFTTDLNIVTSRVAIASVFLENARNLAEGAARSIESLVRNQLFNVQLGGNTTVAATLNSPGTAVTVDDIRGFQKAWNSTNQPGDVSGSNFLVVTFTAPGASATATDSVNTVGTSYHLTGVTPDATTAMNTAGTAAATNNTSTLWQVGGISGTLTFSTNVSTADGTAGNVVQSAVAPVIVRPYNRLSAAKLIPGDQLTSQLILQAKSTLIANGVEPFENGKYRFIADPYQLNALYADVAFQRYQMGHTESQEYRAGIVGEILGTEVYTSQMAPIADVATVGKVHTGMLLGRGALVEAEFTNEAYAQALNAGDQEMVTMVEGVAHVTREPIDRLKQVVTQSWAYIGGFTSPTDITTNTGTIPTASNSAWKRALAIQTL